MATINLTSPLSTAIQVNSPYGNRYDPITGEYKLHGGVDLKAAMGDPIYAVADGVVVIADYNNSYGNYVVIDHGGFYSLYAHQNVDPTRYVQKNQSVSAGQQIGVVGTTGASTGPHLHLEIRTGSSGFWNAERKDPMSYLTGSGIESTGTPVSSAGDVDNLYHDAIPYANVVGRRLSSLATQPLHAYLKIYIGNKLLTSSPPKPNVIQNFEISRLDGTGDTASFTLFDDHWEEIEKTFADHWNEIRIEYGYVDSELVSETYNMMLQDYSISFNSTGVILTISAISMGAVVNLNPLTVTTGKSNPTEAVKEICLAAGFEVRDENFDATEDVSEVFNLVNYLPVAYILTEIEPVAKTADGDNVRFRVDSDGVAYFQAVNFSVENSPTDSMKTYIYQKGYDSVVKDLTFDIKGVFGGTTQYRIASGLSSAFIDPVTKEESKEEENNTTVVNTATGEFQHMQATQSSPKIDPAGYTADQISRRISYHIVRDTTEMYEAQMVIIGDPTIKLLELVRIINITDEGYLHHTSGIYMVKGIIDNIDNGIMMSTLKLVRNGDINEGITLINPKLLIK